MESREATVESFLELLAKHDFLHGIEARHIQFLAEIAEMVTFEPGDFVFRQGELADFFYLIQNGKIEVEAFSGAAGPVVIQTLNGGQLLGWSWLIAPYQWRSDARAIETNYRDRDRWQATACQLRRRS